MRCGSELSASSQYILYELLRAADAGFWYRSGFSQGHVKSNPACKTYGTEDCSCDSHGEMCM